MPEKVRRDINEATHVTRARRCTYLPHAVEAQGGVQQPAEPRAAQGLHGRAQVVAAPGHAHRVPRTLPAAARTAAAAGAAADPEPPAAGVVAVDGFEVRVLRAAPGVEGVEACARVGPTAAAAGTTAGFPFQSADLVGDEVVDLGRSRGIGGRGGGGGGGGGWGGSGRAALGLETHVVGRLPQPGQDLAVRLLHRLGRGDWCRPRLLVFVRLRGSGGRGRPVDPPHLAHAVAVTFGPRRGAVFAEPPHHFCR